MTLKMDSYKELADKLSHDFYAPHTEGARPRQPLILIMCYEHQGGELQSFTFKIEDVNEVCKRLQSAKRRAMSGKRAKFQIKVEDWNDY
jgi:hypothetical protein